MDFIHVDGSELSHLLKRKGPLSFCLSKKTIAHRKLSLSIARNTMISNISQEVNFVGSILIIFGSGKVSSSLSDLLLLLLTVLDWRMEVVSEVRRFIVVPLGGSGEAVLTVTGRSSWEDTSEER